MSDELFERNPEAWAARPSDGNDTLFAQIVGEETPRAGDVGLFGIPFDGAVIGRKGAREGPDAIRQQMARLKTWTLEHASMDAAYHDWGNVIVPDGDVHDVHDAVQRAASLVKSAEQLPFALGGDHSLTYPLVKTHARGGHRIGLINLDAHLDVRDVLGGNVNSGTSFGRLLEDRVVRGEDFVELGIRDFANTGAYAVKAKKFGATIIGADEWIRDRDAAVDRAIEVATRHTDGVYLSLDVDVLDQAHAPGVSAPTPGGVDTATLFRALRRIAAKAPIIGVDIVETAPPLDRDGMTARAAAYAAMHLLAELRSRR